MKKFKQDPLAIESLKEGFDNNWSLDINDCSVYVNPAKRLITIVPDHPLYRLRQVDAQQQLVDHGNNLHEVNDIFNRIEKMLLESKLATSPPEPPEQKGELCI